MDLLSRMMLAASGGSAAADTGVQFVAQTTYVRDTTVSGTDTVTLSGLQADDVVFLAFNSENLSASTGSFSVTNTIADIATWTTVLDDSVLDVDQYAPLVTRPARGLWYKVSTGSSVSIDFEYQPGSESLTYAVRLFAFRGLNTTNPVANGRLYSSKDLSVTSLTTESRLCPTYDTVSLAFYVHDYGSVTLSSAAGYTDLGQLDSNPTSVGNASTGLVSYIETTNGQTLAAQTFTCSGSNQEVLFQCWLVPDGENGAPPVISGSTSVAVTSGGTSVATYTANESVTWSLVGEDSSLFSISSGGVVTFNSPSIDGIYQIGVVATNNSNIESSAYSVTVTSTTVGTSGGGMSLVDSVTGTVLTSGSTNLQLTGMTAGDVMFLMATAYNGNSSQLDSQGSLTSNGWTLENSQAYTSNNPSIHVFRKVATGSSENVTFSASSSEQSRFGVLMSAWNGVDNTSPISNGPTATRTATSSQIGSFLVVGPGVILAITVVSRVATTGGIPSGYTSVATVDAGDDTNLLSATVSLSYKNTVGNVTEPSSATTFVDSAGNSHAGFAYGLRED